MSLIQLKSFGFPRHGTISGTSQQQNVPWMLISKPFKTRTACSRHQRMIWNQQQSIRERLLPSRSKRARVSNDARRDVDERTMAIIEKTQAKYDSFFRGNALCQQCRSNQAPENSFVRWLWGAASVRTCRLRATWPQASRYLYRNHSKIWSGQRFRDILRCLKRILIPN